MKRKGFVVLAVICMVSVVCSIGLLIRLHEVKTKRVYQEILAVSLADARQQAEEYRQAGSDMAYRYLLGDLCVIRDMTARLEAPDSDGGPGVLSSCRCKSVVFADPYGRGSGHSPDDGRGVQSSEPQQFDSSPAKRGGVRYIISTINPRCLQAPGVYV